MFKTLLYLAILAVLGFGVWYFLFSEKSGQVFSSSDAGFTIRDTGSIGKIFLAPNNSSETITLVRKGDSWVVNGRYPVLQSTLDQLLTTMYFQRAAFPVPPQQRDAMIRGLAGAGIKVEVYNRGSEKMRTFYVGGELNQFAGTVMLIDGSETPYVVQIPGFEGYLTTRYASDIGVWRDRIIFDVPPDQIEQISVHYPRERLNDFTVRQSPDGKLSVALDTQLHLATPLNMSRVKSYLTRFSKVYNEGYMNGLLDLDSTVRSMPEKAVIDVRGKGGYHALAHFIFFPIDRRSKNQNNDPKTFDEHFNLDRYFVILNNGADTASVQVPRMVPILRQGYEFYEGEESATPHSDLLPGK